MSPDLRPFAFQVFESQIRANRTARAEVLLNAPIRHRIFKGFALLAMFGVLTIAALLVPLWLEHRAEVTLPKPTGPFAVGRVLYDWSDDETLDSLAPVPGTKRELLVWIWYPAAAGQSAAIDDYVPAQMRAAAEPRSSSSILRLLTRDLSRCIHTVFVTPTSHHSSDRTLW